MSLAALLAIILGASLTVYALLAGADFGAGILDLGSSFGADGGAEDRGDADRDAIAASIGPLWEANHVWLIFSITILFSAFPRAFSAIGTGLLAPFTVALLAIVVRGVALGVRGSAAPSPHGRRLLSAAFGLASLIAPFAFGLIAGGLAEASFAVLVLMVLALIVAALSAPSLWHRLVGVALPAVVAGLAAEGLPLLALARRRDRLPHAAGVGSAVLVLWGWFVAQAPRIVGPRLTLHTAAAPHSALVAAALAVAAVLVVVIPAFLFLFTLFSRPVLEVIE